MDGDGKGELFRARFRVSLKKTVLDPQGKAVKSALHALGYGSVTDVRVGKLLEVTLGASSEEEAFKLADEMARKLLANPVIEDYQLEVGRCERP